MSLESTILDAITRHYIPRPLVPMEQWIRERITIDARQSSEHAGRPMDVHLTPHTRLVFDFFNDPRAEELNVQKSSAASMTSTIIAACLYRIWHKPCNILYLIGNQDEARKMSESYWRPWIAQVWGDKAAYGDDQNALTLYVNGVEIILGSPTAKVLRGKQFGIIVEDESDTLPSKLEGDNQPLTVAERERVKGTRRSKIIRICTPSRKWNEKRPQDDQPKARINKHYLEGDRREYRVPCPHCAHEGPVLYDDLYTIGGDKDLAGDVDTERILQNTVWRCPMCKQDVAEGSQKATMARAGRWVPTKPGSGRIWSAWHTDTCALIGKATWGRIRADLERSRGTADEAGVRRAYLAEPENTILDIGGTRDRETILRHCSHYERGTCPIVPWHTGLYVDVQKNCARFPYVIASIDKALNLYVIDWGECEEFADLLFRDMASHRWQGLYVRPIPLVLNEITARAHFGDRPRPSHVYITRALIDSGYRARGASADQEDHREESVYGFCTTTYEPSEMRYLFAPAKGRAGQQIAVPTADTRVEFNGRVLPLHFYDDWGFKRDLYQIRLASDPANPSPLAKDRPRIFLPRREALEEDHAASEAGRSFLSQLLAERIVDGPYRTSGGTLKHGPHWHSTGPNDLGDCLKGLSVLAAILQRHLMAAAPSQMELPAA